ncbi:MAG: DUF5329 domain-containing protein [Gammaproteobacteria bacterium]|nr:DUF5329 domain-containing protein [Gammaproteobacteria bacterium]
MSAMADVPGEQKREVDYLLEYVAQTDCTIIRNGTRHDADEAVSHIQQKYEYFRDRIDSTESFIEYAASRSTLSGRDYQVDCPGQAIQTTSQWLRDALSAYRAQQP